MDTKRWLYQQAVEATRLVLGPENARPNGDYVHSIDFVGTTEMVVRVANTGAAVVKYYRLKLSEMK